MLVFDERHQVHVALAPDDEDALACVLAGVRVLQDVEQVAALNVKDDVLEPAAWKPARGFSAGIRMASIIAIRSPSAHIMLDDTSRIDLP